MTDYGSMDDAELRTLLYEAGPEESCRLGRAAFQQRAARDIQFCGICGSRTLPGDEPLARRCSECGHSWFMPVTPAVIVRIHRGEDILLARNRSFPPRRFSLIAGYVDAGELLEEAVHREIAEEVGLRVEDLRFEGSQVWPFPHTLMVGFSARWKGGEIRPDGEEIVEAAWCSRENLPDLPPRGSISRDLIEKWRRMV